jgi:hypothetical protein
LRFASSYPCSRRSVKLSKMNYLYKYPTFKFCVNLEQGIREREWNQQSIDGTPD